MITATLTLACLTAVAQSDGGEPYPVTAPPAELGLDPFYRNHVSASGYPVVGSARVDHYALKEAAWLIDQLLAKRPDIREAMIESGSRMVVMAHDEFTTDVPEHADKRPRDYWDRRARGLGGSGSSPVCSSAEENLLAYPGDPYRAECILIHEFAHNIHHRGIARVDPTFDGRLALAYSNAMREGLWKGKYAATNASEYFAEGVQSWFDDNRPPDHDHNHVDTRAELRTYDAALAALCEEVFRDTELVYTKPTTRLTGHLAGYDPSAAPTFRWPDRLRGDIDELRRRGTQRRGRRESWPEHRVRDLEGFAVHVDATLLSGEHEGLGALAQRILGDKLHRITMVMPDDRLTKLRDVPIFLDRSHALRAMQYHPSERWLTDHGHDPAMAKAVHIPRARGLVRHERSQHQPWVVLHELAHAYHDRVLGFDHAPIRVAWATAMKSGHYAEVLHVSGRTTKHYATTDHKEYFAELTEAYFGTNDFFPFIRAELKTFDPHSYTLLEDVWGARR